MTKTLSASWWWWRYFLPVANKHFIDWDFDDVSEALEPLSSICD